MKVTIFGTGYVGLVQAAVLAEAGNSVVCVDIDSTRVSQLSQGEVPIYEPGLERLVQENLASGRLRFTVDPSEGVAHAIVQFIAVGTPPDEDGSADLKHVMAAASTIAAHMEDHRIVVIKSTVPVGTGDRVREKIANGLSLRGLVRLSFDVASNPEFLKEGAAVSDCTKPDRIVIGTSDTKTEKVLRELYAPFNRNHEKIIKMDLRSAELTKYAANCMLATKISFMNEIANIADRLGADIEQVRHGIGSDPRIGYQFIYPGVGYGGSCFPKDVQALIRSAQDVGFEPFVLKAVEERNASQKHFIVEKILSHFHNDVSGLTFAIWGLAFKPNTDDMREAPSRVIMEALWRAGAKVKAYDPKAMEECRRIYGQRPDLLLSPDQGAALEGSDGLIIVTEWKSFQSIDYTMLREKLNGYVIFDGRNVCDPQVAGENGFIVYGVGRSTAAPRKLS